VHSTNRKGNLAEAEIATAAIRLGVGVLKPLVEHGRYDLVFDLESRLLRVQCKWAPKRGDVVVVNLAGFRYTSGGHVRTVYESSEVDAVAAYCEELDQCYLLPIEMVAHMKAVHLRLNPPRNGQRAALNWAAEYRLEGAVAQLGERRRGTPEATGSSPVSSTPQGVYETLGAHEFRERFGWYMQRASRGERFAITRRGKPFARLLPPHDQLDLSVSAPAAERAAA
jgi:prevent-host-death family protein